MNCPAALRWSLPLAGVSVVSMALAQLAFSQSPQIAIQPGETSVLVSIKRLNQPAIDLRVAQAPTSRKVPAQLVGNQLDGVRALEEGPVHEAFAEPVSANAQQGEVVAQQPPQTIDETPPEYRPDGANIDWIPGYWAWLAERSDYVWVSGLWRAIPPGRAWTPGHWTDVDGGHLWVSGFWSDVEDQQVQYLPYPPESLEQGPSSAAPSDSHFWIPGCWKWEDQRYAWRPGYWSPGHQGWTWVPDHYVYTPSGAVLVSGYWDYPLQQRGWLYAPVAWNSGYKSGDAYTPSRVVNTSSLLGSLFIDKDHGHYYYGRGYANRDRYHPWYDGGHRSYYSPFFGFYAWQYGRDSNQWKHRFDDEQLGAAASPALVDTVDQMQPSQDFDPRGRWNSDFRKLTDDERRNVVDRSRKMEQFRSARSEYESQQRLDPNAHLTRYFDDAGHPRGAYSYVVNDYEPSAFRLKNSSAAEELRHQARNQHELYRQQVDQFNADHRSEFRQPREESDRLRDNFKRQVDELHKQQLHDHNRVQDQIDQQHEMIGEMKVEQRNRIREMQSESRRRTARPHEEQIELDHEAHGSFGRRGP